MRHRGKKDKIILPSMVGATGFEPVTPAVSRQYSTAELRTHKKIKYSNIIINLYKLNYFFETEMNRMSILN